MSNLSSDNIFSAINALGAYALEQNLIQQRDSIYCRNRLLELLKIREYEEADNVDWDFSKIKQVLIDYAYQQEIIKAKGVSFEDDFIARVMAIYMDLPSVIEKRFYDNYQLSPKTATDDFYQLSKATDYIKTERVKKNIEWKYQSPYGEIDMTINLSKPEKTPEEIALAATMPAAKYPKCVLCAETEGLSGDGRAPRQNHRIISLELNQKKHFLQYSPYSYFNEHLIILAAEHSPMHLTIDSCKAMLDFVDLFPHYFLATNTDLPLVGGSILSHQHYQGGDFVFPLDKADVLEQLEFKGLVVERLNWPMASIRVKSKDKQALIHYIQILLADWNNYSNSELDIAAYTDEVRHNSINLVVRKNDEQYSVIVVFRNNRCSKEYPKGIFTARDEYRSIKNENIGIIEVMGLAILPARLKSELELMQIYLKNGEMLTELEQHRDFLHTLKSDYQGQELETYIKAKAAEVFVKILENCSVFKGEKGKTALLDLIRQAGERYANLSVE